MLTFTRCAHIPHTQVLYNDLDHWRDAETKRIKQSEVGERRQLALGELLHKETRLLQTIDRLKITAAHEGKVHIHSKNWHALLTYEYLTISRANKILRKLQQ